MRPAVFLAFILLMGAEIALADTTAPSTGQSASVLVLPFTAPAAAEYQWVGQSVQQVLAADLSHGSTLKMIAPASAKPAADADEALRMASDAGVSLVVFGQTQVLDKEIRLTGEVLDVATGRSIAGLKATGPIDQLFHLEDAVASQSLDALPGRMRDDEWRDRTGYASAPSTDSGASSPSVYDYGSSVPYDTGGYYYSYPSYGYYPAYSYPYYSYYPYGFYGGLFFDFHDHGDHHDHHDDFHHGDFHNHGDFHDHGDFHGHSDFHGSGDFGRTDLRGRGFSGGSMGASGGFSRGSMPHSGFTAPRGGMTFGGRGGGGGGFAGGHAGGFSGGHMGGGGGFHGGGGHR